MVIAGSVILILPHERHELICAIDPISSEMFGHCFMPLSGEMVASETVQLLTALFLAACAEAQEVLAHKPPPEITAFVSAPPREEAAQSAQKIEQSLPLPVIITEGASQHSHKALAPECAVTPPANMSTPQKAPSQHAQPKEIPLVPAEAKQSTPVTQIPATQTTATAINPTPATVTSTATSPPTPITSAPLTAMQIEKQINTPPHLPPIQLPKSLDPSHSLARETTASRPQAAPQTEVKATTPPTPIHHTPQLPPMALPQNIHPVIINNFYDGTNKKQKKKPSGKKRKAKKEKKKALVKILKRMFVP